MQKINKLTEEQESKLSTYRDLYINKFFKPEKEADFEEVKEYIQWLYSFCNLKKPIVILVDSPIAILQISSFLKTFSQVRDQVRNQVWNQVVDQVRNQVENQVGDQVGGQVENQVRNQVWNQVGGQVRDQVVDQVRDQVRDQVVDQVWNQVKNQVENQVGGQVKNQVENQVGGQVKNQVENQVGGQVEDQKLKWAEISWYCSSFNSWLSYYNYFNNEIFELKESKILKQYSKVLDLNIFWSVCFENICIVSKNAVKYNRNNNGELHCTTEAAIQFKDGYSLYFVNGRSIEENIFKKVINNDFTFTEFQKLDNEDIKASIITIIKENKGNKGVLDFLGAELVSSETIIHNNEYSEKISLFKSKSSFSWANDSKGNLNSKLAWLSMICPSTGQNYLIEVCPTLNTAIDAAKWTRPKQIPFDLKYNWISAN
jgi:hypothetical protein